MAGGCCVNAYAVVDAELFDPANGTWRHSGNLATARRGHTATLLNSGRVLLAGGMVGQFANVPTASAELYDPLRISPTATSLAPLATRAFSGVGGSGGYHWTVSAPSGGSIDKDTGVYRAGAKGDVTDTIILTDIDGNYETTSVSVGPGISISPNGGTVPPRGTLTLSAAGGSATGFTWSLEAKPSGAFIDGSGVYMAGSTGSVSDVARVTDSLGNTATVTIVVTASLTVAPPSVTLQPRSSQSFSASGGSGTGYTWAFVSNGSGGTLNPSTGVYIAGTAGGTTDVVGVTDSLGNSAQATVTVAGTAPPPSSRGCAGSSTAGGAALPWLVLALIPLLRAGARQ